MRRVWLASYPKSGNTWLRMMLSSLAAGDAPIDINELELRGGIASARAPFEHALLLDSGLLTHNEAEALRPIVHSAVNDPNQMDEANWPADPAGGGTSIEPACPVRFIKTHDAYGHTRDGTPILAGAAGAAGAILLVRDPRDVAPSLANHNGTDIDQAIAFMNDSKTALCGRTDRQQNQLRQRLTDWSGFFESWTAQTDIPIHIVCYENMKADPVAALREAIDFAGWSMPQHRVAQAVAGSSFTILQQQERDRGFREAPGFRQGERAFFRRGESGGWRDELSNQQIARIEQMHAPLMRALGYMLVQDEKTNE